MPPIPLLLWSDSVSAGSGLARITRELATRIHKYLPDVFRVATIGHGGAGSTKLPWPQYAWRYSDDWVIHDLPEVWDDFAGGEQGVMMTIQDPGRVMWLARPETCDDARIGAWLIKQPFQKWGYLPIDASGPNRKLTVLFGKCLEGFDRILNYSNWANDIVERTMAEAKRPLDIDFLPHGIDTSVFYPRDRGAARSRFGEITVGKHIDISDETLVGIVATNQARKDFGTAIEVVARLAQKRKVRLWIHTDALDRYWSMANLLYDFGVMNNTVITLQSFSDDTMAQLYSACDVVMCIGLGEGFSYSNFEALACGCPAVAINYGGHAEWMPRDFLARPEAYRTEGYWNCIRPVTYTGEWELAINKALRMERAAVHLPSSLDWNILWPRWEAWFRLGAKHLQAAAAVSAQ